MDPEEISKLAEDAVRYAQRHDYKAVALGLQALTEAVLLLVENTDAIPKL